MHKRAAKRSPARICLPALLALAVGLAYANALSGPFVFDDVGAIVENPHIRQLWPLSYAMSAPAQATVAGRPIISLSLALNYAAGGLDVTGYHLVNLAVHLLCGLLLYGIVGRTLRLPPFGPDIAQIATGLAWCSALLWLVHPLGTETVNYIVQRTESIMALFYLTTLYCAIRAWETERRTLWIAGAVVAAGLGMASKEVMVTAPMIVVLYDLAYRPAPFRQLLRERRGLYAGLATSWIVLAAILWTGPRSETVGLSVGIGMLDYARNQCVIVVDYLRHTLWPQSLVFDYGYARPIRGGGVLAGAALLALLGGAALVAFFRRPAVAFPWIWFFVILAPTSSIVPIVSEVGAERRMYLPLAGLVTFGVVAGYALLIRFHPRARGVGLALALVLAGGLASMTHLRNRDYSSDLALWSSALAATPLNPRAHNNLGRALHLQGRLEEALKHYRRAVELEDRDAQTHYNLGVVAAEQGRREAAIAHYRRALELQPNLARAHNNLGSELAHRGEMDRALVHFRRAVELAPTMARAQHNLGRALRIRGQTQLALEHLREAVRLAPDWAQPLDDLAMILATDPDPSVRDAEEALRLSRRAAELRSGAPNREPALD